VIVVTVSELAKRLAAPHKAPIVVAKLDRLSRDVHFISGPDVPQDVVSPGYSSASQSNRNGREGRLVRSELLQDQGGPKPPLIARSIIGDGSIGFCRTPSARSSFRIAACRPADHRFALRPHLGRLRRQDIGHRTRLAELLVQSLAVAAR
jgi:hypothetical protein